MVSLSPIPASPGATLGEREARCVTARRTGCPDGPRRVRSVHRPGTETLHCSLGGEPVTLDLALDVMRTPAPMYAAQLVDAPSSRAHAWSISAARVGLPGPTGSQVHSSCDEFVRIDNRLTQLSCNHIPALCGDDRAFGAEVEGERGCCIGSAGVGSERSASRRITGDPGSGRRGPDGLAGEGACNLTGGDRSEEVRCWAALDVWSCW